MSTPNEDALLRLLGKLEERLDIQERMMAQLLMSIAELWGGVEAVVEAVVESKPVEERDRFRESVGRFTEELWRTVHAQTANLAGGLADATGAVANTAE